MQRGNNFFIIAMRFDDHWQTPAPTHPRVPFDRLYPPTWRLLLPVSLIALLAALAAGTLVVAFLLQSQRTAVTVILSGTAREAHSRAATVNGLLGEIGIILGEGDTVSPPPSAPLLPGMVVRIETARDVTITVDGATQRIRTVLTNPRDILASIGKRLNDHDSIIIDGTQTTASELTRWPIPPTTIVVQRAARVHIDDGGETFSTHVIGRTVGEALFEAGMTLYLADTVTPPLDTPVEPNMRIALRRSQPISIIVDGGTVQTRTQGTTVADALADAGVALVGLDYTVPDEDTPLLPGMHIRVLRVREEIVVEEETLRHEVIYRPDPFLELDQRLVVQRGEDGLEQRQVRVRYENDIEIDRTVEEVSIVEQPIDHVIAYGTQIVVRTIHTSDGPREYWRVLRVYATSYHPAALGGDNITSIGRTLRHGVIGADPNIIPYHTTVFVPGYGIGEIADTGPPRGTGMWVDLGYSDHDYEPWSRYVEVYLLTPVPDEIQYLLPAEGLVAGS